SARSVISQCRSWRDGALSAFGSAANNQRWRAMSKPRDNFRIRLAAAADADTIAWHRARMFQDMGELPSHLFETFRTESSGRLRDLIARGDYIGWLASPDDEPDKVVAGAGVQLRLVLPHPQNENRFAQGRQAIIINV